MVVGDDAVRAGDGIVPFAAVHLDGAQQLSFNDARHGHIGSNWYGAARIVDRWWPAAVGLWEGALATRATVATIGPIRGHKELAPAPHGLGGSRAGRSKPVRS